MLGRSPASGELRNDLLMHHPHLVLAPIVIGIINNHKFERLPMP